MNTKQFIKIIEITGSNFVLGSKAGDLVLEALRQRVFKSTNVLEVCFEGMCGVDACFVRNSIASFTKMYCGKIGVMVSNAENENVLDNLCYGFGAKGMPLLIKNKDGSGSCYSTASSTQQQILSYVYMQNETNTHQVAEFFDKSIPNASAAMKKLFDQGYLLAEKGTSPTGGIEYIFTPYFQCKEFKLCP